jgi:hypothetical protein
MKKYIYIYSLSKIKLNNDSVESSKLKMLYFYSNLLHFTQMQEISFKQLIYFASNIYNASFISQC